MTRPAKKPRTNLDCKVNIPIEGRHCKSMRTLFCAFDEAANVLRL